MKRIFGYFFMFFSFYGFTEDSDFVRYIPGSSQQIRAVGSALNFVGTPYEFGGTSREGLDCSGLVLSAFKEFSEFVLPRTSRDLYKIGKVTDGALLPGDLLFFDTDGGPSHVGIYAGDGNFIHAVSEGPKKGVVISSMAEAYYRSRFIGARRILPWTMPIFEIIAVDKEKKITFSRKIGEGIPLGLRMIPQQNTDSLWKMEIRRNDEPYLSKRIHLKAPKEYFFWVIAQPGLWTVALKREGGEGNLTFSYRVDKNE